MSAGETQPERDLVCPACACACDDLWVLPGPPATLHGGCPLADSWWRQATNRRLSARPAPYDAPLDQRPQIAAAARILAQATAPLIFGFGQSSVSGVRAAVALADRLGAVIDGLPSAGRAATTFAFQQVGLSTCTLGEVRHRADLVLLWGADPATTHPRLLEKCGLTKPGGARRLIAVNASPENCATLGAEHFAWTLDDLSALAALRMLARGLDLPGSIGPAQTPLRTLAAALQGCRYGVLFFGESLGAGPLGRATVEALLRLVAELNGHTRFVALGLEAGGTGPATTSNALCWQTGFAGAVNFARRYPRSLPGEATAESLLRRRAVDACLLVGEGPLAALSLPARRFLQQIPTIAIGPTEDDADLRPTVRLAAGADGVHHEGTVVRMDGVPLPLRAVLASPLPSEAAVLRDLLAALPPET